MNAIEKLAEVLFALNPATQPWDGDPFGFHEALRRNEYAANLAMKQATLLHELGVVSDNFDYSTLPNQWDIMRGNY